MTAEEKTQHDNLIAEMKNTAKAEIEARNFQNKEQVESVFNSLMTNMPLDALRKYNEDKTQLETSIRNIAGEVEKINNRASQAAESKANAIMDAMNSKLPGEDKTGWDKVQDAMRNRGRTSTNDVINLNVRSAATMTIGNTVDDATLSIPAAIVESMSMAEFAPKRRGVQFIYDIADRTVVDEITQYKTWLEEGVEQGSFAVVSEGAVKPLVSDGLVRNFAQAKKVAGKYVVTEEFAKFRKDAFNIIRRIINDKMLRDYAAILVVDLNTQAASYVGTNLDGTKANPNDIDAIGAVAAQIETLNFVPDVLVIHPQDKWRLTLEQDSQGRYYLMVPMIGADGTTTLLGFRVVTSTYQTIGSFTLGESGLFKIEEEPITVRMGYGISVTYTTVSGTQVVQDVISDFDSNKFRMIIETWFNDWIPTPYIGGFVKASFDTVKSVLLAP